MHIFITGATGYIGGAVAKALRGAGHDVAALVRPDAETRALRDLGVVLVTGDLESLPSLADTLGSYDAIVHAAFSNRQGPDTDRIAVDVFTAAGKPLVYTSGVWVLGNTTSANESTPAQPLALVAWRVGHEERVLAAGGTVLRPGCVYGGKQSLLADWFAAAEQNRALQLVGDGTNRWALVDVDDLADLYVRAVEQRTGGVLHGIDDSHEPLEACARAVAPNGTIEKTPLAAAREKFGPFADALAVDQVISSKETRAKTGWSPRRTFVQSIDEQWREWRESQRA
ncbi:MAG: NAD-dependent epimerase/dehydratase family protein [Acidobacteria bacterium]|nr:NAD-dependent epimerase/dehydratase family protein [Acidobacteriota bacterium]MBV9070643.1 NAD-dependent epimerase/dehydratase family protein [Acidobacteriota bacterium]MBV9478170.1 NAD-dependent epimerase/dehydratase family protein [Acidobacteriota bacterium]